MSIVWLVVAAVLNPFCCCFGALHSDDREQPPAHCCSAEASSADQDSGHSQKECPHMEEKEAHKLSLHTDVTPQISPVLGLWMGIADKLLPLESQSATVISVQTFPLNISPPGNYQLFCTYLI